MLCVSLTEVYSLIVLTLCRRRLRQRTNLALVFNQLLLSSSLLFMLSFPLNLDLYTVVVLLFLLTALRISTQKFSY